MDSSSFRAAGLERRIFVAVSWLTERDRQQAPVDVFFIDG